MAKKKKSLADWPLYRIILTLASTVLSIIVLTFSALTIIRIQENNYDQVSLFLLAIFIFLGLMHVVIFLKDRSKINLIRCLVLLGFNVALGVVVLFAKDNPTLFAVTAGLYCVTIVISRIFSIYTDHSVRNIILNILIIAFAILIGIGLLSTKDHLQQLIIFECVFIAIVSFVEAMSVALAQLKVKVLIKIVVSTFSLEVLFGLLVMMVSFSFIFVAVEEKITTFPDALWYCFAVVTTIGFGDFVATSAVGRILTVMLGVYGLIVVAVITSIIVNFYNATMGKKDAKELEDIKEDSKENRL